MWKIKKRERKSSEEIKGRLQFSRERNNIKRKKNQKERK